MLVDNGMDTLSRGYFAGHSQLDGGCFLRGRATGLKSSEHTGEKCGESLTFRERDPDFAHGHPDLRSDLQ